MGLAKPFLHSIELGIKNSPIPQHALPSAANMQFLAIGNPVEIFPATLYEVSCSNRPQIPLTCRRSKEARARFLIIQIHGAAEGTIWERSGNLQKFDKNPLGESLRMRYVGRHRIWTQGREAQKRGCGGRFGFAEELKTLFRERPC
jgi:hypothetical protein